MSSIRCAKKPFRQRRTCFPYAGMPIRKRRQHIPGYKFYFGDMPHGTADKAAAAMTRDEAAAYIAGLVPPTPDPA
jgi:hypothetical protein